MVIQAAVRGSATRKKTRLPDSEISKLGRNDLNNDLNDDHDLTKFAEGRGSVAIEIPTSRPGSTPRQHVTGRRTKALTPVKGEVGVRAVAALSYSRSKVLGLSFELQLAPTKPYQKPPCMASVRPSSAHQLGRVPGGVASQMRSPGSHEWALREGLVRLHRTLRRRPSAGQAIGSTSSSSRRPSSAQSVSSYGGGFRGRGSASSPMRSPSHHGTRFYSRPTSAHSSSAGDILHGPAKRHGLGIRTPGVLSAEGGASGGMAGECGQTLMSSASASMLRRTRSGFAETVIKEREHAVLLIAAENEPPHSPPATALEQWRRRPSFSSRAAAASQISSSASWALLTGVGVAAQAADEAWSDDATASHATCVGPKSMPTSSAHYKDVCAGVSSSMAIGGEGNTFHGSSLGAWARFHEQEMSGPVSHTAALTRTGCSPVPPPLIGSATESRMACGLRTQSLIGRSTSSAVLSPCRPSEGVPTASSRNHSTASLNGTEMSRLIHSGVAEDTGSCRQLSTATASLQQQEWERTRAWRVSLAHGAEPVEEVACPCAVMPVLSSGKRSTGQRATGRPRERPALQASTAASRAIGPKSDGTHTGIFSLDEMSERRMGGVDRYRFGSAASRQARSRMKAR